ncbi:MAG: hypothetical protein WD010_09285 [Nitriliruptor sp.]
MIDGLGDLIVRVPEDATVLEVVDDPALLWPVLLLAAGEWLLLGRTPRGQVAVACSRTAVWERRFRDSAEVASDSDPSSTPPTMLVRTPGAAVAGPVASFIHSRRG